MKQKIWITSDHHFNHTNIIKYCSRPFNSVEEMNEYMIKKWNEKVIPGDIVIHLGDFAFKHSSEHFKKRLNGTIILVMGNHDSEDMEEQGFILVKEDILQINNLLFTHRPLLPEEIPQGFLNIHGHVHQRDSFHGINVCVERTNYVPIELNEILRRI